MTPLLTLQLAWLFATEASAVAPSYGRPVSPAQQAEGARLHGIADVLFDRAEAAGLDSLGTDVAFGPGDVTV